jgi:hypothetical protein
LDLDGSDGVFSRFGGFGNFDFDDDLRNFFQFDFFRSRFNSGVNNSTPINSDTGNNSDTGTNFGFNSEVDGFDFNNDLVDFDSVNASFSLSLSEGNFSDDAFLLVLVRVNVALGSDGVSRRFAALDLNNFELVLNFDFDVFFSKVGFDFSNANDFGFNSSSADDPDFVSFFELELDNNLFGVIDFLSNFESPVVSSMGSPLP